MFYINNFPPLKKWKQISVTEEFYESHFPPPKFAKVRGFDNKNFSLAIWKSTIQSGTFER